MKRSRHSTGGSGGVNVRGAQPLATPSAGQARSAASSRRSSTSSHHKENTADGGANVGAAVTARMKAADKSGLKSAGGSGAAPIEPQVCLDCLKELRSCKDESGRLMSRLFMQLPSKKLYPDYYDAIASPISLIMIRERVERNEYASMAQFRADLELLFSNAQAYNVEGSEVHSYATHMRKLANKFLSGAKRGSAAPQRSQSSSAASSTSSTPVIRMTVKPPAKPQSKLSKEQVKELCAAIKANDVKKVQTLIDLPYFNANILMNTEMFGNEFQWGPLHCAAYHGRTRIISALAAAGANVELHDTWYGGTPLAWAAFGDQVKAAKLLVTELNANRDAANSQGQVPFDLVSTAHNPAWLGVLTDKVVPPPKSAVEQLELETSVKLPVGELLRKMFDILVEAQDSTGRPYSEIFRDLPSRKSYPDYFMVIKQPMSFNMIEKQLRSGACDTFQKFEMDVAKIFENAMFFNQEGSVIYSDAKYLKQMFEQMAAAYKKARQELDGPKIKLKLNSLPASGGSKELDGAKSDILGEPPVRQKRKYVRRSLPAPRGGVNGTAPPMMQFYTPQYLEQQRQQQRLRMGDSTPYPIENAAAPVPQTQLMDMVTDPPPLLQPILSQVDINSADGDKIFQFQPTLSMRSVCIAVAAHVSSVVVASVLQPPPTQPTTSPTLISISPAAIDSPSMVKLPMSRKQPEVSGYSSTFINAAMINSRRLAPLASAADLSSAGPAATPTPPQKMVKYEVRLEPGVNCLEMGCYGQWRQCESVMETNIPAESGTTPALPAVTEPRMHAIQQIFRVVICRQ